MKWVSLLWYTAYLLCFPKKHISPPQKLSNYVDSSYYFPHLLRCQTSSECIWATRGGGANRVSPPSSANFAPPPLLTPARSNFVNKEKKRTIISLSTERNAVILNLSSLKNMFVTKPEKVRRITRMQTIRGKQGKPLTGKQGRRDLDYYGVWTDEILPETT